MSNRKRANSCASPSVSSPSGAVIASDFGSFGKFGNWAAEGIHSPIKRWVLHCSPRAGGKRPRGVAYYAMRMYVLRKKLSAHSKRIRRTPRPEPRYVKQRLRAKLRRQAAKAAARSAQSE